MREMGDRLKFYLGKLIEVMRRIVEGWVKGDKHVGREVQGFSNKLF